MKNYLYLFLIVISSGCSKEWLNEKPNRQEGTPVSYSDFQYLLDNTSTMNVGIIAFGEIAADGHYVTESAWSSVSDISFARNAYSWSDEWGGYRSPLAWQLSGKRISIANLILEGLLDLNPANSQERLLYDNVKGQALFNRAAVWFSLAQQFTPPFMSNSDNGKPGIIFRLGTGITDPSTRISVADTYRFMINDLIEASRILPERAEVVTRGSKLAAYGLLARIYLTMDMYDSALHYVNKSLSISSELLDFNSLSTSPRFIGGFITGNPEVIFHDLFNMSEISGFLTTSYFIEESLYNLYAEDDLRKILFFRMSGGRILFKGNYHNSSTTLFSGLAIDEMYLIKAECLARMNMVSDAMSILNQLLVNRWRKVDGVSTYVNYHAEDADEALRIILEERRKELILRGVRWSDLRRLNKDDRFKVTITRTIDGRTYVLEPASFRYTFPIPTDVVQLSGISQNEGWNE